MKVIRDCLAICLIATLAAQGLNIGSTGDKLQESLLEAKRFYDLALDQLGSLSTDQILVGAHTAIELHQQWVIDYLTHEGRLNASEPDYDDKIQRLNRDFNYLESKFEGDLKFLDDVALKQKAREKLLKLKADVDSTMRLYGFSS
ncbi:hypothetical protein RRG08_014074 [Elysia crispata]|uniref:Uncharacterized protein n=1 Tax=Elysia crispata TaxID=231223 RepID=A0AAE1A034_9GAST|nr:hypothetical protein RRG08_014074 [Elysia crispata]